MTCDHVQAMLIDALAMRAPVTDAAVLAHIESCPVCRSARDDYNAMWQQLGRLGNPQPSADARVRFDGRLADVRRAASADLRSRRPWYVGAWAATVLIAALAGFTLGASRSRATPTAGQPTFLILLHVDSSFHHGQTPAAAAAIVAEYGQWVQHLPDGGTLVGTAKLSDSAAWFGPPLEPGAHGDHLAGFFMIRARDRAAAQRIAATCPHLKYGGRIELRMIGSG